jgi:AbrB family looped-hinge helix DNA binding protein
MSSVVGSRGQITIDKAIRDRLGIKPKDVAVQEVVDGQVVVRFLPAPHRRDLYGILKSKPRRPMQTRRQIEEAVEEAMAEEHRRREGKRAPVRR